MKPRLLFGLYFGVTLTLAAQTNSPAGAASLSGSVKAVESYGKLPLAFEANQGQMDPQVKFLSRGSGYSLSLAGNEAVLILHPAAIGHRLSRVSGLPSTISYREPATETTSAGAVLRMKLLNADPMTEVSGEDEQPAKSHYFIGNDPKRWHTNIPQFAMVRYKNIYPGVDLVYYGHQRELEYDFVLRPGADSARIRLGIEGTHELRMEQGDVVLATGAGNVYLRSPRLYQCEHGERHEVRGGYVILGKHELGFRVGPYDRSKTLVIDPILAYSTRVDDSQGAFGVAVDAAGNAYVAGVTYAGTSRQIVITKINADGSSILYRTYLGGTTDEYYPAIAVDSTGHAYVSGGTQSTDFPTKNAIQSTNHGYYDAFVTKLSASGSALVYSTYMGGSVFDAALGIAIDKVGNAYVIGVTGSTDFPTANALRAFASSQGDAFVTKINAAGSAFVYSTYLTGSNGAYASGVATDKAGNAYIIGATESSDFPTVNALQPYHGGRDAFLSKINATGSAFVYSTYLGGSGEEDTGSVTVDSVGSAYLVGATTSIDFPTVNPVQAANAGLWDVFVAKVNAGGSALVYSTYLGGSGTERAYSTAVGGGTGSSIAVDQAGNAYITASTPSNDFPVLNAIQPIPGGGADVFVAEINSTGKALVYSTFLGGTAEDDGRGIAIDVNGSAYVAGSTSSGKFPVTPGASDRSSAGAFLVKIAPTTFVSVSPTKMVLPKQLVGTLGPAQKVSLTNKGPSALTINRIYFAGQNPSDFVESSTCGATLLPGIICNMMVAFSPIAKGTRQAALLISDSDPANPTTVSVTGVGTVVSLSPAKLDFGDQPVGTSSAAQNVTLINTGNTMLKIFGISITGTNPGDFSQTNTCGTSVPTGGQCTVTVTFKPTVTGPRTARVSVKDDGGGSPQIVPLAGTGT